MFENRVQAIAAKQDSESGLRCGIMLTRNNLAKAFGDSTLPFSDDEEDISPGADRIEIWQREVQIGETGCQENGACYARRPWAKEHVCMRKWVKTKVAKKVGKKRKTDMWGEEIEARGSVGSEQSTSSGGQSGGQVEARGWAYGGAEVDMQRIRKSFYS